MRSAGVPEVTEHARLRWLQRADTDAAGLLAAWLDGHPLRDHGLDGDEARYHPQSRTVLVRHENRLVTVLSDTNLKPAVRQAIQRAQREGPA